MLIFDIPAAGRTAAAQCLPGGSLEPPPANLRAATRPPCRKSPNSMVRHYTAAFAEEFLVDTQFYPLVRAP